MKTVNETLKERFEGGLDAARMLIRAKTGESQMLSNPGSIYYQDLRDNARVLEAQLDQLGDDVLDFISRSGWSAKEQKGPAGQMDLTINEDVIDAEVVEEVPALPPATEPEQPAEQEAPPEPEKPGRAVGEPPARKRGKK